MFWHWYTSWHHPHILVNRSATEAEPCSRERWSSLLRCPSWAWVVVARACSSVELSWGGRKELAWMLTVRFSRLDRSGSWPANARRFNWGVACTACYGTGSIVVSAWGISSTGIWSPRSISSLCYALAISLLRICMVTSTQKSINKPKYFCYT
jgi:hypothetical protein